MSSTSGEPLSASCTPETAAVPRRGREPDMRVSTRGHRRRHLDRTRWLGRIVEQVRHRHKHAACASAHLVEQARLSRQHSTRRTVDPDRWTRTPTRTDAKIVVPLTPATYSNPRADSTGNDFNVPCTGLVDLQ